MSGRAGPASRRAGRRPGSSFGDLARGSGPAGLYVAGRDGHAPGAGQPSSTRYLTRQERVAPRWPGGPAERVSDVGRLQVLAEHGLAKRGPGGWRRGPVALADLTFITGAGSVDR